jgi:DNA-binding transcriptional MerR regulator
MSTSVMAYTVGEVSKIAKVSVRALHHWDEIGLVKPSRRSPKGYRLYTDDDLDRLQQVLFFRELGFRLEDIVATLADPAFDRREALRSHRALLSQRVEHARALLELVDRTLRAMNGEEAMRPEDKFEAFDPSKYQDEAAQRWGDTPAFAESLKRTKQYTPDDWKRMRAEADEISEALAERLAAGVPATNARATALAEAHRQHIDRWFYPCSHEIHVGLGEMYVNDPRFAAGYERVREGLAAYLRDAIRANAIAARSAD